ncbi:MAG: hypothetical protein ABSA49_03465 [Rhizomicrobium sp.]
MDFDYPAICTNQEGYNHSNLTWQFSRHKHFDPEAGTSGDLMRYFASPNRKSNVVVSAVGLANCLTNSTFSARIRKFLRGAVESNDAVYLIFSFRTFWRYIESLYLEQLQAGYLKKSLPAYIEVRLLWFREFFEQIAELRDIVGENRVLAVDVDQSDSISAILALLKIDESKLGARPEILDARLGLKKAALLYLYQFGSAGRKNERTHDQILRFVHSLDRMADLPDDIYDYHLIAFEAANRIQEIVRAHIPDFLSVQLESASRAVDASHHAILLDDVVLSINDVLAIADVLIPVERGRDTRGPELEQVEAI